MVETLLSSSQVLLFGLEMDDLVIVTPPYIPDEAERVFVASNTHLDLTHEIPESIDERKVERRKKFLLLNQNVPQGTVDASGYYKRDKFNKFSKIYPPLLKDKDTQDEILIYVKNGKEFGRKAFNIKPTYGADKKLSGVSIVSFSLPIDNTHSPFSGKRDGLKSQLQSQLEENPIFARVYGFSFEGFYYSLPRPVIFLVHGEGEPVSEVRGKVNRARAPGEPSLTGVGEADFQFSDEIMVWSYDKADYTIRMDVETGMFEDVLLAAMLGGSGGFDSAGMNARGMNARGMNARGMNARGMNARGMNARGGGNSD